jgi:pSer/pThr/pTyr-binding forkhead associated (FHA) protein
MGTAASRFSVPAQVTLTVTGGPSVGQQHAFTERTTALIGREGECHIRFPDDKEHRTLSRHHCLLDINPPEASIRDLGSRGGTYVNGLLIGKRERTQSAEEGANLRFAEHSLKHGDQIKVGQVVLGVAISAPAVCVECLMEIPEEEKELSRLADGQFICGRCRTNRLPRTITQEPGTRSLDPEQAARRLLGFAQTGAADLQRLRGYRIERELGRGGMGAVFLAKNVQSGECVALKLMLPHAAATQRLRDQFMREAANTKAVKHRHVVELRDLGYSEGSFFFALEYCEGGSVADLLKKSGCLSAEKAVPLVLQALEGLEYAHGVELPSVQLADGRFAPACGLVHRDIKPHNILLAKDGDAYVAKIADYGLAKAFDLAGLSGLSVSGQTGGTPGFMPRQQLIDYRNARPEVDVWAMAASLYYMLTLRFPRDFNQGMDGWRVVLQTDPIPIRQRCPDISAKLANVIDDALVERPEIRFKTAGALRNALQSAV